LKKGNFVEFFDDSEIAQNYEDRKEKIEGGGLLKMFDEASFLKNKPGWEKEIFRKVNNFCIDGIQKGVVVAFLETYTRYSKNNLMFAKVKSTSESLKIYLKLRYSEIENPQRWLRDYAKISRQAWVEINVREEDLLEETILLDNVFDLIKQSFNRVIRHPKLSKVSIEKSKVLPGFASPTLTKFSVEVSTDGYCQLGIRIHRSQLQKVIEKLLE